MKRVLVSAACCLVAHPSWANPQETALWKQLEHWSVWVDRSLNDNCFLATVFLDGTVVRLGFMPPDENNSTIYFGVGNSNWASLEEGKDYILQVQFDFNPPWDVTGRVKRIDGVPLLLAGVNHINFLDEFIRKQALMVIYRGQVIANLELRGSALASQELTECQKALAKSPQWKDAPPSAKDPFATQPPRNFVKDPFATL